ncbi:MAG: hypothetical protein ACD_3C00106G0012 [uncultured bacterium (gcode 4)]|uniref:DUF5673 domain-containing protein n=1 Tax=uncultured bacterium (gcode 4) TaxID=1234023 RepID=K2FYN9_9BACT|nr:MAG: hypothetical protein ACD_3C00106G0012 [uncultured bacterium (gcode 4)]
MFNWQITTKKEKWAWWYMIALVISVALIIWWYITGLYAMSIVILLVIWVYILVENNSPDTLTVEINEDWINIWDEFYDFPKISTFTIMYSKNRPISIRLKLKTKWFKVLDIPFQNASNPAEIRAYLLNFITEDPKWEISWLESLTEYLKL